MPVTVPTPPQVVVDKGTAKVSFPAKMVSGLHKLWALKALAAGGAASACACLWVRSSGAERPSRHFPPPEQGAGLGRGQVVHTSCIQCGSWAPDLRRSLGSLGQLLHRALQPLFSGPFYRWQTCRLRVLRATACSQRLLITCQCQ